MSISAGLLMFKIVNNKPFYFLAKHGGPHWANIIRSWSIPKGGINKDEALLDAAVREFQEETSIQATLESLTVLTPVKTKKNKIVHIFAFYKEWLKEEEPFLSNTTITKYRGKKIEIPEMERGSYFSFEEAKEVIIEYQLPIIEELNLKIINYEQTGSQV